MERTPKLRNRASSLALALASCAAVMGVARASFAGESARLEYTRLVGADACPDEAALRRSVVARLGYDPFSAQAPRTIAVSVRHEVQGHAGSVRVVDEGAPPRAERRIVAAGECAELVEALALTISVVLDPMAALRPDTPVAVAVSPEPIAPAAPVARADARPSPLQLVVLSFGIGPMFSAGDAPAPVGGGLVYVAARRGIIGGLLELNATLNGSAPTAYGTVSSWSTNAVVGACGHLSVFFGCALGTLGILSADADVAVRRRATAAVAATGARLGILLPLGRSLELRLHAEGLLSLTRHRLAISMQDVYEFSPGKAGVGVAVGIRF